MPAEPKTRPGDADADAFLRALPDPVQRDDALHLAGLMSEVAAAPAVLWGGTIVGFGRYHYRYASGREGDWFPIGFAPRKGQLVLYLAAGFEPHADLMARLGKHKTGKSCIYVKKLSDLDEPTLRELLAAALAHTRATHPPA
jgi:hypothetical protein